MSYRSKVSTSGELRYYHGSSSNDNLFKQLTLVLSEAELNALFRAVQQVNLCDIAAERRPTTLWKLRLFTNITFYLDKLLDGGLIGDGGYSCWTTYATTDTWWAWTRATGVALGITCAS